ncbi:LBF_2804 family protein [Larkinella harenae]
MSDSTDSSGDFDQATKGRTTLRYLARAMHTDHPSDEPFVLNSVERLAINRIKGATMLVSSALGVLCIWVFYLPHVLWTNWFVETHTALGDWPLISVVFGALILYLLVYALIFVHNGAIRLLEITCQFPRFHDASYSRHMNQLAENSTQRSSFRLRLSPRPLLPWTLSGYLLTVLLLAFLVDGFFQVILRLMSPQPVSAVFTVLSSTLVVGIGNGWASYRILQQAQMRVMAPLTIRQFTNELAEEFGREPIFRNLLPVIMKRAGIWGKQKNYAHLLLLEAVTYRFAISPDQMNVVVPDAVSEQLRNAPAAVQQGLERLFVFSILIDGHLSSPEREQLRQLQHAGVVKMSLDVIESMRRNFAKGEGLWV